MYLLSLRYLMCPNITHVLQLCRNPTGLRQPAHITATLCHIYIFLWNIAIAGNRSSGRNIQPRHKIIEQKDKRKQAALNSEVSVLPSPFQSSPLHALELHAKKCALGLCRQLKFLSLEHFCEVDIEEVDIQACLENACSHCNRIYDTFRVIPVYPIRNV